MHATGRTGRFSADVSASSGNLAGLVAGSFAGLLSMTSADAAAAEDAGLLLAGSMNGSGSYAPRAAVAGILHASGVLADAMLGNQSLKGLRTAWAPKVAALERLGGAYGWQPGSIQLLFSSIAALLGSPGQANYSAANAALDAMSQSAQAEVRAPGHLLSLVHVCTVTCLPYLVQATCASGLPLNPSPTQLHLHTHLPCRACPAAACSGARGLALAWLGTTPPPGLASSALAWAWWRPTLGWLPLRD